MSWDDFCNWWSNFFKSIGDWFIDPAKGNGISNLGRMLIALILAVAGHYLIKIIMAGIRKIAGVKKGLQVDLSVKTFVISLINVCFHFVLVIAVFASLNIDFSNVAAIASAGTVAIGLSLQNLISSFASGIILLYSKYFKTGDYIEIRHSDGVAEGHIKKVNLITTTLRTYDGYEITVPNDKMTKGVITNFTREPNRRVVIKFAVDYTADIDKIKEVIVNVMKADKRVVSTPVPYVHVWSLDQHSIELNAKCWTPYEVYWDVKFDLSEKIILALRDNNVMIPYQQIRVIDEETKPLNK